ncbi:MAG: OmpA family protein [Bacteroidota bacterium]
MSVRLIIRSLVYFILLILVTSFQAKGQVKDSVANVIDAKMYLMKIIGTAINERGGVDTIKIAVRKKDMNLPDSVKNLGKPIQKIGNTGTVKTVVKKQEMTQPDSLSNAANAINETENSDTIKTAVNKKDMNLPDSVSNVGNPVHEIGNADTIKIAEKTNLQVPIKGRSIFDNSATGSDSINITITNIGNSINTPFDEYAPIISADGSMMIFTSRRLINLKDSTKYKQGMENIYVSYYNEVTKWSPAKILGPSVNLSRKNNSAMALSNDGQRLLIYRGTPDGNIYQSTLEGEEWSLPVKLPAPINSARQESSASISPDERIFYFCSDRKRGQGGSDIWMCKQNKMGKWGKAENLGPVVNTSEDEESVFIHPDGKTLYFSSNGHDSNGGFDIFKTVLDSGKWSAPVNIGSPINTPKTDLFFTLTADGKKGYYSSTRPEGLGRKDIYEITITYPESNKSAEPKLTLFKGEITDINTNLPLDAEIEIMDNDKNELVTTVKSNSVTGKFLVSLPAGKNYGVTIKKDGYLFFSENYNVSDTASYLEINKAISLMKVDEGNKIRLKNIFYDYGKATLKPESISELNQLVKLLEQNIDMRIEIGSYTDSESSTEFNLKLSQARAQAVLNYLYTSGISKERMVAKGYGEADPIFSNDTEEGREINRRTEFKILNIESKVTSDNEVHK